LSLIEFFGELKESSNKHWLLFLLNWVQQCFWWYSNLLRVVWQPDSPKMLTNSTAVTVNHSVIRHSLAISWSNILPKVYQLSASFRWISSIRYSILGPVFQWLQQIGAKISEAWVHSDEEMAISSSQWGDRIDQQREKSSYPKLSICVLQDENEYRPKSAGSPSVTYWYHKGRMGRQDLADSPLID
jgi:hypothetical protein